MYVSEEEMGGDFHVCPRVHDVILCGTTVGNVALGL